MVPCETVLTNDHSFRRRRKTCNVFFFTKTKQLHSPMWILLSQGFCNFPSLYFSLVCFIYWIDRWERKGVGFIDKVWYFCESLDFFLCAVWFKAVVAIISAKSKRQWSLELSRREAPLFLDRLSLCEHFVIPSWEEDSEEKSTIHNVVCGLK